LKFFKIIMALGLVIVAAILLVNKETASSILEFFNGKTSASPSPSRAVLTMAKYDAIKTGMSYIDVVAIIGFGGEELSRNKINGVPGVMESVETIMYQWVNSGGSNMNAIFQNNRLFQKAQFGLR